MHETFASTYYQTFSDALSAGTTQPGSANTYANWVSGLGSGEGIGSFQIWLLGGAGVRAWGEVLVSNPLQPLSATAASGWNASIFANPWGAGYVAAWWTSDPGLYLRPGGANIGTFSLTGDFYVDANANANGTTLIVDPTDPGATAGTAYRIWFGDTWMNPPDASGGTRAVVFDASGWGTLGPNYGTFSSATAGDSGWEGRLTMRGTAVPEPPLTAMLVLGALVLLRRRH